MEHQRLTNWWMSWEDLDWPAPDVIDRIRYKADKYVEANISAAVIYGCHFRWDYMPYFTLLHDYLATVAEELHQRGIKLYDHHSVNLVHRYDTREQMRHVMLHSPPHIPFCPSREAAATWEYRGKRLNDWRMVDVKNGQPLYFPQYAGEGFCYRNPGFKEAYQQYALQLIEDTGIDGLMADDAVFYMHLNACGCEHCRAELKRRTGVDLPPIEDQSFWGNWDNPAWKAWLDLRFDATAEFHRDLRKVLPEGYLTMSCGPASATAGALTQGSDARKFLEGCNYTNLELCGNTPPYKADPVTVNRPLMHHLVSASYHQAAAREKGVRCYGTGYGHTEPSANIIWAVNRFLDADCHFSTLKPRLGLPKSISTKLPDEFDVVGKAYTFEKDHPELYEGQMVGQLGLYFSTETRNHTCFGAMNTGYYADFQAALQTILRAGISPHTIFDFPKDAGTYPVIAVPSPLAMTEAEQQALRSYVAAGGKVIITGPCAMPECKHSWKIANRPVTDPVGLFSGIRDGVWVKPAAWISDPQPACTDENVWQTPADGIYYNPHRLADVQERFTELCRKFCKPMPVEITGSQGYLIAMMENPGGIAVQLLAEEYDTDIDHALDEMRFHRSRVNYINKVTPVGVDRVVKLNTTKTPRVFTPFNQEAARVEITADGCIVTLPENTAYAVLYFPAQ